MPETPSGDAPPRDIVLLTGATGFIGRRLQTRFLDLHIRVRAFVRPESKHGNRLDPRAQRVEGAFDDPQALARALSGAKAVVHCAGAVRGGQYEAFAGVNVEAVRALASAMSSLGTPPALLLMSSLAAREPELSDYAKSKNAGERVLEDFPELNWTIVRPAAVYGPGDVEMRPLLNFIRRGLVFIPGGNRSQRLSLLHVDDLCGAVLAWLKSPSDLRHGNYEIDDGRVGGYNYVDIADAVCRAPVFPRPLMLPLPAALLNVVARGNERLAKLTGRAPLLTTGKVREFTHPEWLCDNAAFSQASGWRPEILLAEGAAALFAARHDVPGNEVRH
jgi:nucleoside-diphosphate-sugar epimerase